MIIRAYHPTYSELLAFLSKAFRELNETAIQRLMLHLILKSQDFGEYIQTE